MTINEKIIYDSLVEEFKGEVKSFLPLTEMSRNEDNNKDFVISDFEMFNFDCFNAMEYGVNPQPKGKEKEKTPDGLHYRNNTLYFIEFKEGQTNKLEIRMKIHEALLGIYNYAVCSKGIISREDFFNLRISYSVIKKGDRKSLANPFYKRIYISTNFFNLKSMNGFLLQKTHVFVDNQDIEDFLNTVTEGKCAPLHFA